jgi:uncharacterized protein
MIPSLLLLIVSISFAQERSDAIAGRYALRGVMEVGSELLLKPDGSFEYYLSYGAADYWSKGTWKHVQNTIVLTTPGQDQPPFRLTGSSSTSESGTRVRIKNANGRPVEHIEVVLRTASGEHEARTGPEGTALFEAREGRSVVLRIRVYGVEAGPFEINPAHNDFSFEINGEEITQVRFRDERLAIDGKDLILRYWNADKPMRYVRE